MNSAFIALAVAVTVSMPLTTPAGAIGQTATNTAASVTATSSSPQAVEHVRRGEQLLDNSRIAEAEKEFAQALKLDPNFILAHAYHGGMTPGADGLKEVESAEAAARDLPEAERALVEAIAAARRDDHSKAKAACARLTELVPADWHAHYVYGEELLTMQDFAEALSEARKAAILNPGAGAAQNLLGYAALRQGDAGAAVAAFEKYVALTPNEANAEDSLGEALLAAGRFSDAEAAFRKAHTLSPKFWQPDEGIADARVLAGDVDGGREAFGLARSTAADPVDKMTVDVELAAVAWSQRDFDKALAIIDATEKAAKSDPALYPFAPMQRAVVLTDAGRYRDALVASAAALALADGGRLPAGLARNLHGRALVARAWTEARLGDGPALTKTSAALEEDVNANPPAPAAISAMHHVRGLLALAKGDLPTARREFEQCSNQDQLCKWNGILAAEKAGDVAGADRAREELLKLYLRDPLHLVIRTRLARRQK
jgi:tetratricopeptide (TPR) repeat protein